MAIQVLLLEEEESIRECLVDVLETEGYEVDWGVSTPEALEILSNRWADVLIVDLSMSSRLGFEVLNIAEKNHMLPQAVIAMSTNRNLGITEIIKSPNYRFLSKPFDLKDFLEAIKSCEKITRLGREHEQYRPQV